MTVTTALLAVGAVARITRFLNSDTLFDPIRNRIDLRCGQDSYISYLLACAWCASIWVSALVTTAAFAFGDSAWFQAPAFALSASYLYGLLAQHLDD